MLAKIISLSFDQTPDYESYLEDMQDDLRELQKDTPIDWIMDWSIHSAKWTDSYEAIKADFIMGVGEKKESKKRCYKMLKST